MQNSPLLQNIDLFLDDKPSVFGLRQKARTILTENGFPTPKTEAWKYTNIKELTNGNFIVQNKEHTCSDNCCHHQEKTPFIEIKFCHGQLHIEEYNTPAGLKITPLPIVLFEGENKQYLFNAADITKYPFAALNGTYLEQGICITVEKNTKIQTPIHIKYNQTGCNEQQINIHNIIIAEKNTELEIIEEFTSTDSSRSFINIVNEFYLKNNSQVNHYKIQKENKNAYHIALNAIRASENSSYNQYYHANSSRLSRNETTINLEQKNAHAEVYSTYTAQKDGLIDITTNINHLCCETTSNQQAKAILDDNGNAVFQGKIYIAPNAIKTSGHQLHKALYLNDNATLNCKPELEIYADDVKCSHGASCGEIDKEQLFYLTSRGISKKEAIQMLTLAHFEEIYALIPNQQIKEYFFS